MRADFKDGLRAKLSKQAESQFRNSTQTASVLSFIFLFMKRYSIPAIGLTIALVLAISKVLPGSVSPLTAEEVLAQLEETYQENVEDNRIYYEKVLKEDFENGVLYFSEIEEDYTMPQKNSYLIIKKDPDTQELDYAMLHHVDENGDGISGVVDYSGGPDYSGGKMDTPLTEAQLKWIDIFKGKKTYCYEEFSFDEWSAKIYLALAAEDQSVFQIGGAMYSDDYLKQFGEAHKSYRSSLFDQDNGVKSLTQAVENLIDSDNYEYELIQEEGKTYHLFKEYVPDEFGPGFDHTYYFYINPETFQLEKHETYDESGGLIFRRTLLDSAILDSAQESEVFDPSQFEGMELRGSWPADNPIHHFSKPGCYDNEGELIRSDVDAYISDELRQEIDYLKKLAPFQIDEIDYKMGRGYVDLPSKNNYFPEQDPFRSLREDLPDFEEGESPGGFILAWQASPMGEDLIELFRDNGLGLVLRGEVGMNDTVTSPYRGTVVSIDNAEGHSGNKIVTIEHELGDKAFKFRYSPLETNLSIGQLISEGEAIGRVVHPENAPENWNEGEVRLMFQVMVDGELVDPLEFLEELNKK